MNKGKKVLVIVLTVLLIISSLVSFLAISLRAGLACPTVYSDFMPRVNAYSAIYPELKGYVLSQTDYMELPEDIANVPSEVFDAALPEDDFNESIGNLIGGGLGWLFYNQDEVTVPIAQIQANIQTAIDENETVKADDQNLHEVMSTALTNPLKGFLLPDGNENTLRGYLHYYLTGGLSGLTETWDYYFDVYFYYFGNLLNWITICSLSLVALLMIVILILNKNDINKSLKLPKVLLIVCGSLNALLAICMVVAGVVLPNMDRFSERAEYLQMAGPVLMGFAILFSIYAVAHMIVYGLLCMVGRASSAKQETKEEAIEAA